MRAMYVSVTQPFAGVTVDQLHDQILGEWNISPQEASAADLLVPVHDGRPVGLAWRIRAAIHGTATGVEGEQNTVVVTMGKPILTAGLVPDEIPTLSHGVAVADLVLAA
jgi:hypothetical protein